MVTDEQFELARSAFLRMPHGTVRQRDEALRAALEAAVGTVHALRGERPVPGSKMEIPQLDDADIGEMHMATMYAWVDGFKSVQASPQLIVALAEEVLVGRKTASNPGSRDAVRDAVRLLTGERPEWLEDTEEWSLPDVPSPYDQPTWLKEAVQLMVSWLDGYTRPDQPGGQDSATSSRNRAEQG
jgi:hypothetical protein